MLETLQALEPARAGVDGVPALSKFLAQSCANAALRATGDEYDLVLRRLVSLRARARCSALTAMATAEQVRVMALAVGRGFEKGFGPVAVTQFGSLIGAFASLPPMSFILCKLRPESRLETQQMDLLRVRALQSLWASLSRWRSGSERTSRATRRRWSSACCPSRYALFSSSIAVTEHHWAASVRRADRRLNQCRLLTLQPLVRARRQHAPRDGRGTLQIPQNTRPVSTLQETQT